MKRPSPLTVRTFTNLVAAACWIWPVMAAPLVELQYVVTGQQLRVSPVALSIPKGISGSALVELTGPSNTVPADAFVEAMLRGPSFPARRIIGQVNAPLLLPPLPLVGDYQLDNIRLVRQEATNLVTLFEGSPSSVPVRVFDEVLVSRVTSRPLTLQEIQEKGIVLDQQNFRAVEFEVGFVLEGKTIPVKFPVVAPNFQQATEIIPAAELEERLRQAEEINNQIDLSTVLPEELETARLNIDIKGINFQVTEDDESDLQLRIPPIPALMVIPGNIGFLNQFFSMQIFTENAAPQGSGLSAFNILAELKLPAGPDQVLSTLDDPLRFARIGPDKVVQPIQSVVRPGADGTVGTSDDIGRLFPGESGQGEFLVEGLQEGLHVMNLDLTADLDGLAAGTVKIKGKAAGSVLVRNPKFSLAFSHPRTIRAGEPYDAYVTVLNTSGTVANLVQVTLASASISGGVLESAETVELGTIVPGQTATAKFRIRSQRTGAISFSNLTTSEDSLVGRFRLRMGIDERGVTLSPDTIAMPDFVASLPSALVDAANRVLGQALSIATAPQLPAGVKPISKAFVTRRVLDLAEAGQRVQYNDPLERVVADLLLDWQGGREFNVGFDQIIRETDAGREWRDALSKQMDLADGLNAVSRLEDRLPDLAGRSERWAVFALDTESGEIRFGDGAQGQVPPTGSQVETRYDHTSNESGLWFVEPLRSNLVFQWTLTNEVQAAEVALAVVNSNGTAQLLRWSISNLVAGACLRHEVDTPGGLLLVDTNCDGTNDVELAPAAATVNEVAPTVISVRQDITVQAGRPPKPCIPRGTNIIGNYGTVVAVLFSKPLRQELVNVPSAYQLDNGNTAATVQIQPGGRVALLNLRQPVGPIVGRILTVSSDIRDVRGNLLTSNTTAVATSLSPSSGLAVRGRVARADGSPAIGVPVTLTMHDQNDNGLFGCEPFVVRVSQTFTDGDGYFEFDFVLAGIPYAVSATDITGLSSEALQLILDSAAGDQFNRNKLLELANSASAQNTLLQAFAVGALPQAIAKAEGLDRALLRDFVDVGSPRTGTIVPVALRFRGRATVEGHVLAADGFTPVPGAAVNLFPDPDSRELGRGVFSDTSGRFAFFGVPLGVFTIEVKTSSGLARTVSGVVDQPGGTTNIAIVLTTNFVPRTDLVGRVTEADNATPHPGASVFVGRFIDGKFGNVVAMATADPDGYWRATGIPANVYDVVAVSLDGKRKGERRNVAADAGTTNQISIALQGFSVVIGRVQTIQGQSVSNAIVAGGEVLARTDSNGVFRLTGVPTGRRTINAGVERTRGDEPPKSKPAFAFPRFGSAQVNVAPGVENFVLVQLEPRGSVIGRVVDETGSNAVTGINVALPEIGGFSWVPVNERGEFAFEGIPLKRHIFSAPAPAAFNTDVSGILDTLANTNSGADEIQAAIGEAFAIFTGAADPFLNGEGANFNPRSWGFTEVELRADGEVQNIVIQFLKQSTIAGKVLNGQSVPIGARVRLTGIGPAANGMPTTVLRGERNSDPALGTFTFEKEALIGDWGLQAASPFFSVVITASGQTSEIQPDETNIVLRFPAARETTGRLTGFVFNPDGTPASSNLVVRIPFRDSFLTNHTVAGGFFDTQIGLDALGGAGQPGKLYFVEASDPVTGAVGAANVLVLPGVSNSVNIRLLGRGALAITVLQNDGSPAPGARVDFEQGSFPQLRGQLTADSNGQVLFLNIFEGSYAACAQFVSGPTTLNGRVAATVTSGETNSVTIRLGPTGTIEGRFVRRDLVTPVGFAQIAVGTLGFATTDSNGFFRVSAVPLGTYRLTSQDPVTGIGAMLVTTLSVNGQTNNVTLIEQSRGEIRGAVIASDGVRYVPGALVTISFSDGITPQRTVTTGPDGLFSFPGSPAGSFRLNAEDPVSRLRGANSGVLPENVASFEIIVPLQPLASVVVTVLRPDATNPATNVNVRILGANVDRSADALDTNIVQFTGLPLGSYRIIARSLTSNSSAETSAVLSAAGQTLNVTNILAGVGVVLGTVFESDGATPVAGASVRLLQRTVLGEILREIPSTTGGAYLFDNVTVGSYQVSASFGALAGAAAGVIATDGEIDTNNIVLAPSGIVRGRLMRADRTNVVVGEDVTLEFPGLSLPTFLVRSGTDGRFEFQNVPLGLFVVRSTAINFNGIVRLTSSLTSDGETNDVGDLVMDEDDPHVVTVLPPNTATAVPVTTTVDLLFNEALASNTISPNGIYLQGPTSTVAASVQLLTDSLVRITPLSPLRSLTTYEVIVIDGDRKNALGSVIGRGPEDLVGRPLIAPFVSSFTTADNHPPQLLSVFPANGQANVEPFTEIGGEISPLTPRLNFSEPIRDTGFVFIVAGPDGLIGGTASVGLNGLVLAFGAAQADAFKPNTTFTMTISNIFDLAGNPALGQPFVIVFSTTDTIGPEISVLRIADGRSPVAGGRVAIEALLATNEPGASVRFTQDLNPIGSDNSQPFRISVTLPASGSTTVRATATDGLGNEGDLAELILAVVPNQPPTILFARGAPPTGALTNTQVFTLNVSADDDLEVTNVVVTGAGAFSFTTNFNNGEARTITLTVPSNAVPGTPLQFHAQSIDQLGATSEPAIINLDIIDVVRPVVAILNPANNALLNTAQPLDLIVSSSDNAGSHQLQVELTGGIIATQTITILTTPFETTTNTVSFSLAGAPTVGTNVVATVRAVDDAGNTTVTARTFLLPDTRPPQLLSVNPANGAVRQSLWLSPIGFDFDEALDLATTIADNVLLTNNAGLTTPFVLSLANGNRRLLVSPTLPLEAGVTYTSVLLPGITDLSSNRWENIGGASVPGDGAAFTFTTAAILNIVPTNGAPVIAGQSSSFAVNFEAGLGANFLRFVLTSTTNGAPVPFSSSVDVSISSTATNATANLFVPSNAVTANVTVTAHRSGQPSYLVAELDLEVRQPTGQGTVHGLITAPNGQPVSGVQVTLLAGNHTDSIDTGTDGLYEFAQVPLGSVRVLATDPATALRGQALGVLAQSAQVLPLNIQLAASGTVTGTVFRADGTTAVPGVSLTLSSSSFSSSSSSAAQGNYIFDFVPLGSFTLDVTDPATGDRGRASSQLTASGQTRALNVLLNGQGRVLVTVLNSAGNTVSNAEVRVFSQTIFGGVQTLVTGLDGTATFERVLAGNIFVTATELATSVSGSTNSTVGIGTTTAVTVRLQPTGTIRGRVFDVGGTNPVAGATVRLPNFVRQVTADGNGDFTFTGVPVGTHVLEANDLSGRLRVRETGLQLSVNATLVRDLVFIGLGTVTGRVLNPDGTGAPDLTATVTSSSSVGGTFSAISDVDGTYTITSVPAGAFSATAADPGRQLQGEAGGVIAQHEQVVTANIQLLDNTINLPLNIFDANNFFFDLQAGGSIESGHNSVFSGDFNANRGGLLLDLVSSDGSPTRFTGGSIGTKEQAGREIAVRQILPDGPLAGLDVTRKIFIPRDGYFARYLEILHNPGGNLITLSLRVSTHFIGTPAVFNSSSGDAILNATGNATDRWVVVDDNLNADPFFEGGAPAVAFAFDGPNAPDVVDSATFISSGTRRMTIQWTNVTIPAGGTVAYLHFVAQQTIRSSATTAADRLSQLPPEALAGLSPDENGQIRNFLVPSVSALDPLPSLLGKIHGRALAADTTTTLSSAEVDLRSTHPLFNRLHSINADENGLFSFRARLLDEGQSMAVPLTPFTLFLRHPQTFRRSTNQFEFLGTNVTGNLSVQGGHALASSDLGFGFHAEQALDGRLDTAWITASGDAAINGRAPFVEVLPGGASSTSAALVTQVNVRREQHGFGQILRGRLELFNAANSMLFSNEFDFAGGNADLDLPDAADITRVRLTSVNDDSFNPGVAELEVIGSATVQNFAGIDLIFGEGATVRGIVRRQTGAAVTEGGSVMVSGGNPFVQIFSPIAANGSYVATGLTPGSYMLEAFVNHPQGSQLEGSQTAIVQATEVITRDIVLLPTGGLTGTVRTADSNLAVGVTVQLRNSDSTFFRVTSTDGDGRYSLTDIPVGNYLAEAFEPNSGTPTVHEVAIVQDQITVRDFSLAGLGTVELDVVFPSGSPSPNSQVNIRHAGSTSVNFAGFTDANGHLQIPNVPVGTFVIQAFTDNSQLFTEATNNVPTNTAIVSMTVMLPGIGSVIGRVTFANGNPVNNASVSISGDNVPFQSIRTNPNGDYSFAQVPAGRPFTIRASNPTNGNFFRAISNNIIPADGDTLTVDVTLPALAILRVTVLRSDGTPLNGAFISLRHALQPSLQSVGSTGPDGTLNITNVPEGPFTVQALDPNSFQFVGSATGTILLTDNGQVVQITINAPIPGNVQGTVFAADTTNRVPGLSVQILDAATGTAFGFASTDTTGFYRATSIAAGSAGFKVVVTAPGDSATRAEGSGTIATTGQTITVDLILPVSVGTVQGTVFASDGVTPVPNMTVQIAPAVGGTVIRSTSTGTNGSYLATGVIVGPAGFRVVVRSPSDNAVRAQTNGNFAASGQTVTINLTTDALFGTIQGTIHAGDGLTPVRGISVRILDAATSAQIGVGFTDAEGFYRVTGVPVRSAGFRVVARSPDNSVTAEATGNITTSGQAITIDLTLAIGVVKGTVFFSDGITPVSFPNVQTVQTNPANPGFGAITLFDFFTTSNGQFTIVGLLPGPFIVMGSDPNTGMAGRISAELADVAIPVITNITIGDFAIFNFNLDGADGFRYDVQCDGRLSDGGTVDEDLEDAYDGAYRLRINGSSLQCVDVGHLELIGRQIVLGPSPLAGIEVTRKIFVPAAGGFARFLEVLSNPSETSVNLPVRITHNLGADSNTRILVQPSSTANTYAITDDGFNATPEGPLLAHVFGGPDAAVTPSTNRFQDGSDSPFYEWSITIAAGEAVILMHFAVQGPPGDQTGLQTQAEALVNLTNADALFGLTTEERVQIINFNAAEPAPFHVERIEILSTAESRLAGAAAFEPEVILHWTSGTGLQFEVEVTSDFQTWVSAAAVITELVNGKFQARIPATQATAHFYRLHLLNP